MKRDEELVQLAPGKNRGTERGNHRGHGEAQRFLWFGLCELCVLCGGAVVPGEQVG